MKINSTSPKVAGESEFAITLILTPANGRHGRAKNVPGIAQGEFNIVTNRDRLAVVYRFAEINGQLSVGGVKSGFDIFPTPVPSHGCLAFLNAGRITQQHLKQFNIGGVGENGAVVPVANQRS